MIAAIAAFTAISFVFFAWLVWQSPRPVLYAALLYWLVGSAALLSALAYYAGYPKETTSALYEQKFWLVSVILDEQSSSAYLMVSFDLHHLHPRLYVVQGAEYGRLKEQLKLAKQKLGKNMVIVGKLSKDGRHGDQGGGEPDSFNPPQEQFPKGQ